MAESTALIDSLRRLAATGGACRAASSLSDAWLHHGLARGQLHEVYALHADQAASAAGFAMAAALAAGVLPLLWLRTEAAERQGGRLHATGLAELGLTADTLLLVVVADEAALLKVAADAARCPGLGTLLVETWGRASGLDLTATRRLMLAAEASGVTVVSLRVAANPSPSAAATRWGVAAAPSTLLEAGAPGVPSFAVELLRRRGGPAGERWHVEWNRDDRIFSPLAEVGGEGAAPSLPGAGVSVVADRAVAQRPPASVRRAG